VNKSREVIGAEGLECMGEMRIVHKDFFGKPEDH
jgi:hypothetical protein